MTGFVQYTTNSGQLGDINGGNLEMGRERKTPSGSSQWESICGNMCMYWELAANSLCSLLGDGPCMEITCPIVHLCVQEGWHLGELGLHKFAEMPAAKLLGVWGLIAYIVLRGPLAVNHFWLTVKILLEIL